MSSVGAYLRELRQRRGVSLEEIARTTRVAQRYLEAIEDDTLDALPAPVFIRGFIRAYCQALGESPEAALAAYDGRNGRPGPSTSRSAPVRAKESEPRARGAVMVSFVLLVVLGMALFTVALLIHPRERSERVAVDVRPEPRPEPRPVPPPLDVPTRPIPAPPARTQPSPGPPAASTAPPSPASRAPQPPAGPAAPSTPAARTAPPSSAPAAPVAVVVPAAPVASAPAVAATPAPVAPPIAAPVLPNLDAFAGSVASPYRLVARTNETTWIRVRTDDGRTSEENVPAGEVREWVSNRPFVLTIGNAGGVTFELNGRPLPNLGAKGAVIPKLVLPPEPR